MNTMHGFEAEQGTSIIACQVTQQQVAVFWQRFRVGQIGSTGTGVVLEAKCEYEATCPHSNPNGCPLKKALGR